MFRRFSLMKIKKGDQVVVITGKDKGKKGVVIRTNKESNRVVVEKVALGIKHVKERQGVKGGRIEFEAPIALSNVKVICPSCEKSTRVQYEVPTEGKKHRVCRHCSASLEKPFVKS